ncbi:hypothetical protein [Hymenobacter jeollabukensis]|uniref:Uncharacterized protein n=1 Tax=Hymenobacter jeollabukensis TaxID=2025313 RepID=A0A5R8WWL5_9BACT|nr:hypothetical protein [Hymenobacter jeollabukensis]TLM96545.1 hypothetical protein FDY95_00680 [Hymenobacter jeollabukensis]
MEQPYYSFAPPPLPPPRPPVQSADGRWRLTDDELILDGRHYSLLELERVTVQHVRWLLWILLGAFTLGGVALAFLQNWLRTPSAMLGMVAGALMLAWGQRGANRVRLARLGLDDQHHALPGELTGWQQLGAETNIRIHLRHQRAAQEALALLAAQEAEAAQAAALRAAEFGYGPTDESAPAPDEL